MNTLELAFAAIGFVAANCEELLESLPPSCCFVDLRWAVEAYAVCVIDAEGEGVDMVTVAHSAAGSCS